MKKFISGVLILLLGCIMVCSFTSCKDKTFYETLDTADNLVNISSGTIYQTMEGFGASSAWWSQVVGGNDNADEIVKYLYSSEGLGLNIYRYNIGGGSIDKKDVYSYYEDERMCESFLKGENYTGSTHDELLAYVSNENNYDFTKDKNAMNVLKKSLSYGCIDSLVLFVNSPHYLMTKNNLCHSTTPSTDNLAEENYDVFAAYLMQILKYFVVDNNYPVTYISPINEPQWKWGGSDASQEGCHFEPASAAKCLNEIYIQLKAFNEKYSKNIKLDAYESGGYPANYNTEYLEQMSKYDYFKELDHISYHAYKSPTSRSVRETALEKLAKYNISFSQSEYCQLSSGVSNTFETAQYLGYVMCYDIGILHSNTWQWWIAVSNYNYEDGLLYNNWDEKNAEVKVAPRYYMMKHYSKFVQEGAQYIQVNPLNEKSYLTDLDKVKKWYKNGDEDAVFADDLYNVFKNPDGSIVIVYINITDYEYEWNIKDQYETYAKYTSTDGNYLQETSGNFNGQIKFEPNSITTIVLK